MHVLVHTGNTSNALLPPPPPTHTLKHTHTVSGTENFQAYLLLTLAFLHLMENLFFIS